MSRSTHRPRRAAWSMSPLVALLLAACGSSGNPDIPATPGAPAWFREEARSRGIDWSHDAGRTTGSLLYPEIVGGGGALFDLDGDGRLDLYLVQTGRVTAPEAGRPPNQLFRNVGEGRFENVTEGSGLDHRGVGMGVAVGDADNDGRPDIYVTNLGPDALFMNEGRLRFLEVDFTSDTRNRDWSTSAAFADLDQDGLLDLYVVRYLAWSPDRERTCTSASGVPDYCHPSAYQSPLPDAIYRNLGGGRFEDVSQAAGVSAKRAHGLGVIALDADSDGRVDIFVANDGDPDHLWLNRGGMRFEEVGLAHGCAIDQDGVAKAGMGVTSTDLTGDGYPEILVVNLAGEADSLFINADGRGFTDGTARFGLRTASRRLTRFGVGFADFDNDGLDDLYYAAGRVMLDRPTDGDPYAEPNLLLRGARGGRFEPVEPAGGTDPILVATSRAAIFGDIDDDGGIDVVIVNRGAPVHLLRNVVADRGNWIRLRALDVSGRDACNATIECTVVDDGATRRITREVRSAWSYLAANDPRVHLGLGTADGVRDIVVRWPEGGREAFGDLPAGRTHDLRRGRGRPLDP